MDDFRDLIFAEDSSATVDIATDLAIPVIAEGGFEALSYRAVAERARCSRQAVQQWFGTGPGLRHAVAGRFTARWTRWLDGRTRGGRYPEKLLPNSPDVVTWSRVWMALVELGSHDDVVTPLVVHARDRERRLISAAAGREATAELVAGALAVVEGLRVQLCAPAPLLGFDDAAELVLGLLACKQGARHALRTGSDALGGLDAVGAAPPAGPLPSCLPASKAVTDTCRSPSGATLAP